MPLLQSLFNSHRRKLPVVATIRRTEMRETKINHLDTSPCSVNLHPKVWGKVSVASVTSLSCMNELWALFCRMCINYQPLWHFVIRLHEQPLGEKYVSPSNYRFHPCLVPPYLERVPWRWTPWRRRSWSQRPWRTWMWGRCGPRSGRGRPATAQTPWQSPIPGRGRTLSERWVERKGSLDDWYGGAGHLKVNLGIAKCVNLWDTYVASYHLINDN